MSSTQHKIIKDLSPSSPPPSTRSVLFFWASWHEESARNGSTDNLFRTLASSSNLPFYRVEAEALPDLSSRYNVTVVPTFVLLDHEGVMIDRIEGLGDIARITQAVSALQNRTESKTTSRSKEISQSPVNEMTEQERLNQKLKNLVLSSQVMIFIKGTPKEPKCGFSRQAVDILSQCGIAFGSFDILTDESVRQGLKGFSDWPTFPQLYVRGEFMGGLDIMKELAEEEGGLPEQLNVDIVSKGGTSKSLLDERLKKLISRHKVMLFMKGLPSSPQCGFSRQICEILNGLDGVSYDSFNILEDEEVRQGLKKLSDWPTYPQLYANGELVGGLDIVKEMAEEGDLMGLLSD